MTQPQFNALLNGASALLLCLGYLAIRRGNRRAHIGCMLGALTLSLGFLVSYLIYHYRVGSVRYEGPSRPLYLVILLTHTVLAVANVPLVVLTVRHAAKRRFERHRRIARWTFPIWLYVNVTGVVVYLFLYG